MGNSIIKNWKYDTEYNGKEEGCGDLIMTLFKFFKTINSGTRVCVIAHDAGASSDIAAWCRSTNKILLESQPPFFLVEKK
jgi:TusA-related sulfurtransferase